MSEIIDLSIFNDQEIKQLDTETMSPTNDAFATDENALKAYTYYRKTSNGIEKPYHIAYKYKPKTQEKELKKRNTAVKNRTVEKLRSAFAQCTAHDHTGFMRERMSAELEQVISKVCDAFNARSARGININAPQTLAFEITF